MSSRHIQKVSNTLIQWLSSRWFFWAVVGVFAFEALWIALSFRYPMLFDEGYHYGLIKIFSTHQWPFFGSQPHEYDAYRDIAHEGSYAFHYLLSYPYLLIKQLTDSSTIQIIFLRLINIAFFGYGLVLCKKLLGELGVRRIFINISLLFFVLLPMVPFVAATINYDNLLFPLTVGLLILGVRIVTAKKVDAMHYVWFLLLALFASLIKFTVLPIVVPALIFIIVAALLRTRPQQFMKELSKSARQISKPMAALICGVFLVLFAWFAQIYVQNIVRYGSYRPSCTESLGADRCMASPIIQRNLSLVATRDDRQLLPPTTFLFRWLETMYTLLSMTGTHTAEGIKAHTYMPLTSLTLLGLIIIGFVAIVYGWRDKFNTRAYYFLAAVFLFYTAMLFLQNLSSYMRYHAQVAIQPRYLIAFIPLVAAMMVVGLNHMVPAKFRAWKVVGFVLVLVAYLNFSGLTIHIMRSDETWYWQDAKVVEINQTAKKVLQKIVFERF